MKNVLLAGLAGIILSGCAARGAERDQGQQAALDEVLAGRTAQAPVDCVSQRDLAGNRGYGPNAILFEARSPQLVYLNRPPAGCPELTESRALRTQTTTGRLCRMDVVTVFDPVAGINYGSCSLGEFVPYRR